MTVEPIERRTTIARNMLAGKLRNCRQVVLRAARESPLGEDRSTLQDTARELDRVLARLPTRSSVDVLRGDEGEAGRLYFGSFEQMVRTDRETFHFRRRTRRPPRVLAHLTHGGDSMCAGSHAATCR